MMMLVTRVCVCGLTVMLAETGLPATRVVVRFRRHRCTCTVLRLVDSMVGPATASASAVTADVHTSTTDAFPAPHYEDPQPKRSTTFV
jgi:hypothetical protein